MTYDLLSVARWSTLRKICQNRRYAKVLKQYDGASLQGLGPRFSCRRPPASMDVYRGLGTSDCSPAMLLAANFRPHLSAMKEMLQADGVELPHSRRHPAQLMRFAVANGLIQAGSPSEQVAALRAAVAHLKRHMAWYNSMRYLQSGDLRAWLPYCSVRGTWQGYVALRVDVGRMIQEKPVEMFRQFPTVLVSLMELIIRKLLAEDGAKPSQLVALVHVGDVTLRDTVQITRTATALAVALNQNYPGRLHKLYVLDLPSSSYWVFQFILRFVHPATRTNIISCSSHADVVPQQFEPLQPSAASATAGRPPQSRRGMQGAVDAARAMGVRAMGAQRAVGRAVRRASLALRRGRGAAGGAVNGGLAARVQAREPAPPGVADRCEGCVEQAGRALPCAECRRTRSGPCGEVAATAQQVGALEGSGAGVLDGEVRGQRGRRRHGSAGGDGCGSDRGGGWRGVYGECTAGPDAWRGASDTANGSLRDGAGAAADREADTRHRQEKAVEEVAAGAGSELEQVVPRKGQLRRVVSRSPDSFVGPDSVAGDSTPSWTQEALSLLLAHHDEAEVAAALKASGHMEGEVLRMHHTRRVGAKALLRVVKFWIADTLRNLEDNTFAKLLVVLLSCLLAAGLWVVHSITFQWT